MQLDASEESFPINIRWFFTEENATVYQDPSPFRSTNWDDPKVQYVDTIGEVLDAPKRWCNGEAPIDVSQLGPRVGSALQFRNGRQDMDPFLDSSNHWGLPVACIVPKKNPPCPVLSDSTSDRPRALLRATGLCQMGVNGLVGLTAWANVAYGSSVQSVNYRAASGIIPDLGLVVSARENALFIGGTANEQQLLAQIVSTLAGPTRFGDLQCSLFLKTVQDQVSAWATALAMPTDRPLAVSGFSMGGGVTQILSAIRALAGDTGILSPVGFGAPRVLGNGSVFLPRQWGYVGIGLDHDPVTQLPPAIPLLLSMLPIIGLPGLATLSQYGTAQRPCRLDIFPEALLIGEEPTVTVGDLFGPLANAVNTGEFNFGPVHDMAVYATTLLSFYDGGLWPFQSCWPIQDVANLIA
jgi:hypothetical protein